MAKVIGLKHIVVSDKNYEMLRQLGHTSDSFNDVVSELLKEKGKVGLSASKS